MLIDGRLLPYGTTLPADVVIIGAGPAGITCAEALVADGLHVVLLEAAGREHGKAEDDALDGDGCGEPFPIVKSRHRGFGGTSTHWTPATGLRVRPLDGIDLIARAGRPVDAWPVTATDLDPWYDRAHESIGLRPGYAPSRWFDGEPTPLVWPGGPELAMFQFAPHDTFVERFDRVREQVDLVLHATVDRLEVSEDGTSVERVSVRCPGGNRFGVAARTVVLACGGIDNPRVLLMSDGPDGRAIGNQHDNVGRWFMDHLSVDTGRLETIGDQDLALKTFREARAEGSRYQAMLWLGEERIEAAGLPNAAFWIDVVDELYLSPGVSAARRLRATKYGRPRRRGVGEAAALLRHAPDVVRFAAHKVRKRRRGTKVLSLRIMIEQTPERDSRVTLSSRRDELGLPRAMVDWRILPDDLAAVRAHQDLLGDLLEERGVACVTGRFEADDHATPIMSNYHHLGTTRMHDDPRHGVVDTDGRVHSTRNLYVVGSSVFTSGGYLNPTLTIIALAIKTAAAVTAAHQPVQLRRSAS